MEQIPVIPYGHQSISDLDIQAVHEVMKAEMITTGPKVAEFEQKLAEYCGAKYAVVVSSGTAALHIACLTAGIKKGDVVLTSPMTFVATANAVVYCNGTPVFVDIRPDTMNIDCDRIAWLDLRYCKAIIVVDFAGHPADLDEILELARERDILVIEDASHALGAEYKGRKVGSISDMTVFSFHPVKHITTGEGGAVMTDNEDYYQRLLMFRNHGIVRRPDIAPWYYEISDLGFNYRLTDIQCALGISQLKKLDSFIERRREIVRTYNEAFGEMPEIIIPTELEGVKSAYHLYVIQLKTTDRRKVFDKLRALNIGVNVHYIPVYRQPYYSRMMIYKPEDYLNTERYYQRALTLPLYPSMSDGEVEYVIKSVKESV